MNIELNDDEGIEDLQFKNLKIIQNKKVKFVGSNLTFFSLNNILYISNTNPYMIDFILYFLISIHSILIYLSKFVEYIKIIYILMYNYQTLIPIK